MAQTSGMNFEGAGTDHIERPRSRGLLVGAVLGLATVLVLITGVQRYVAATVEGERPGLVQLLVPSAITWYFWAAWTPVIFLLGRRFRLAGRRWRRTLPIHLLAAALLAVVHTAVVVWTERTFSINPELRSTPYFLMLRSYVLFQFQLELPAYFAILGARSALDYYQRYRERAAAAAQLEAQLAQAQLLALKMQLHPHFLFNTLHAIGVLVESDARAARHMVATLGDLLRLTLADATTQIVPLERELQFLRLYLEIEQTRFHDRLRVRFDVDDDTLKANVPNFILQPIVENAVRYGIAPRSDPGVIEIAARRTANGVELEVWNDGPRLKPGPAGHPVEGVGLATTRQRLHKLYGDPASLAIANAERGGVSVRLRIPVSRSDGRVPAMV